MIYQLNHFTQKFQKPWKLKNRTKLILRRKKITETLEIVKDDVEIEDELLIDDVEARAKNHNRLP